MHQRRDLEDDAVLDGQPVQLCSARVWQAELTFIHNCLPAQIDFSSLSSFTRTVKKVDLAEFLMCFN